MFKKVAFLVVLLGLMPLSTVNCWISNTEKLANQYLEFIDPVDCQRELNIIIYCLRHSEVYRDAEMIPSCAYPVDQGSLTTGKEAAAKAMAATIKDLRDSTPDEDELIGLEEVQESMQELIEHDPKFRAFFMSQAIVAGVAYTALLGVLGIYSYEFCCRHA